MKIMRDMVSSQKKDGEAGTPYGADETDYRTPVSPVNSALAIPAP